MKLHHRAVRTSLVRVCCIRTERWLQLCRLSMLCLRIGLFMMMFCSALQRHFRPECTPGGPLAAVAGCAPLLRVLHCTAQRPGESVLTVCIAPICGVVAAKAVVGLLVPRFGFHTRRTNYAHQFFWCWLAINIAPQHCARLKTKLCSQVLPCMHMDVCFECIQKHEQQQRLRDPTGSVTCPMCRAPIRSTMPLPVQSPDIM